MVGKYREIRRVDSHSKPQPPARFGRPASTSRGSRATKVTGSPSRAGGEAIETMISVGSQGQARISPKIPSNQCAATFRERPEHESNSVVPGAMPAPSPYTRLKDPNTLG